MKSKYFLPVFLLCIVFAANLPVLAGPNNVAGVLVVKFIPQSPAAESWLSAGRNGEIAALRALIGPHTTRAYIADHVLQAVRQRLSPALYRRAVDPATALEHVCIIEYSAALSPEYARSKLVLNPDILYAEPMPVHTLLGIPNDPEAQNQYHLDKIEAYAAWDVVPTGRKALIAVIDTGIEYEHEDLAANIYNNPGETGMDKDGKDKRSNGIDDDANGFTDDWRGWDFGGANGEDNNASFGNDHGVHVSGIAGAVTNNATGVAGVGGEFVQILPIKISSDQSFDENTFRGPEAILYAAAMGADVINCSWGSLDFSHAEADVIDMATAMGSLVVAAAGNDGIEGIRYPGGYHNALGVAWLSRSDRKSGQSNYSPLVDISANGSSILSTVPGNRYSSSSWSGTSMAAPIAAGVAALVKLRYPELGPRQVAGQLIATATNVDSENQEYSGMLGSGRVNAKNAVSVLGKAMEVYNYTVQDANGNGLLEPGENINIHFELINLLQALENVSMYAASMTAAIQPEFANDALDIGAMATMQRISPTGNISFQVPSGVVQNTEFMLGLRFEDNTGSVGRQAIRLVFNPSYQTLHANNISVSFNNIGHLGYNDFSDNEQGDGFRYKGSESLMYEGGVILANSAERMAGSVHEFGFTRKDNELGPLEPAYLRPAEEKGDEEGVSAYFDVFGAENLGIRVQQKLVAYTGNNFADFIFLQLAVENPTANDYDNFHAGFFADWDINFEGAGDQIAFLEQDSVAYVYNARNGTYPYIGMQLLSGQNLNFYAFDTDGSGGSIETFDNFTKEEKWQALSSGLTRTGAGPGDVASLIAAGPISLAAHTGTVFTFCIGAATELDELAGTMRTARELWRGNTSQAPDKTPGTIAATPQVFPNPLLSAGGTVQFTLEHAGQARIEIYDMLGRNCRNSVSRYPAGSNRVALPIGDLGPGTYTLRIVSRAGVQSCTFAIAR